MTSLVQGDTHLARLLVQMLAQTGAPSLFAAAPRAPPPPPHLAEAARIQSLMQPWSSAAPLSAQAQERLLLEQMAQRQLGAAQQPTSSSSRIGLSLHEQLSALPPHIVRALLYPSSNSQLPLLSGPVGVPNVGAVGLQGTRSASADQSNPSVGALSSEGRQSTSTASDNNTSRHNSEDLLQAEIMRSLRTGSNPYTGTTTSSSVLPGAAAGPWGLSLFSHQQGQPQPSVAHAQVSAQVQTASSGTIEIGEANQQRQSAPKPRPSKKSTRKPSASSSNRAKKAQKPPPVPGGLTGHPSEPLYMQCDDEELTPLQCLVRKQIELFEADEVHTATNARGRNKALVLGQVGIRCRHCTVIPPKQRKKAALYYPAKLDLLYQACQTMANVHLCETCEHIPSDIREQLIKLREQKMPALVGRKYWGDGARAKGVEETEEHGLRFFKAVR